MKIAMPCLHCLEGKSNEERRAIPLRSMPRTVGELADGGIVETKCAKGHETTYTINLPRFEVIFETGALSLLEGNYAHAVAAFTTALEAFFEFYVSEVTFRNGLEVELYEKGRGPIGFAERQLGAFLLCHLLEQREPYDDPGVETIVARRGDDGPELRRLTLPRTQAPTLLRLLANEGISGASMFPGADGVVRAMREESWWDRPVQHAPRATPWSRTGPK
jgi:hypothetical protein